MKSPPLGSPSHRGTDPPRNATSFLRGSNHPFLRRKRTGLAQPRRLPAPPSASQRLPASAQRLPGPPSVNRRSQRQPAPPSVNQHEPYAPRRYPPPSGVVQ